MQNKEIQALKCMLKGEEDMINQLMLLVAEAYSMLEELDIYPERNISWSLNKRFKRTLGRCRIDKEGIKIEINYSLFEVSYKDDPNYVLEIIIHELFHTLEGCYNHQDRWKHYASKVNSEYGTNIARLGFLPEEYKEHIYEGIDRGVIRCKNGCFEEKIPKHYKRYKKIHLYVCSKCGEDIIQIP